jgi:predicted dehydrogenase
MKTARTLSRRSFLRTSAATTAAASLAALDLSRFAHAAGGDIIKVGMIGCGGRNSGAALQALNADKGARLVAMHDYFLDRVHNKREALKAQKPEQVQVDDDHCFSGFDGYKKVIEASDVVLIANAAKFHPLQTLAAIQAGKHVFTEKPHGIDPAGVKMMQAAAIGDIVSIEENFLRAPYGLGDRNPKHSELEWQISIQYRFVWLSGDDVVQSLVHNLDRASWCMKEAAPLRCHGMGGRSTMVEGKYGNVFDHHAVVYLFPNNIRLYAFCRTTTFCYDEYSSLVFGTKGRANIMGCRITGETNWRWEGQCDPYQVEHDRLFAAIRAGEPINNGDYMCRSTMIAVMGQISCYTGKEVTWEQINASNFAYPPLAEECKDGMDAPVKPGPDGSYPVYIPGKTQLI